MSLHETPDLYFACYLKALRYRLIRWYRDDHRLIFVFDGKPTFEADKLAYYNDETTVRPRAFVSAIREIKSLIHSEL